MRPSAGLARLGHLARIRPDETDAVLGQRRDIPAGRRMRPHARVHRRRDEHRRVGGEKHRRGEVVGEAVRHLAHEIGGRRRDHDQVGLARQPDMTDIVLVLAVEQLGEHLAAGQRADRERRDEFLRRRGHDCAHARAALAEPPDQVERLVRGDAAAR